MFSNTFHTRNLASIYNENPMKNIKNNLNPNRKKNALKVMTNTVQSIRKFDDKCTKQLKILPMQKFETEIKCKSPLQFMTYNEEFNHFDCITQEKDFLPSSMTCNIGMLSNFFSHNYDESDWFLEDYNNVMINKINEIFEHFGEPEVDHSFPTLPMMEFPEPIFS